MASRCAIERTISSERRSALRGQAGSACGHVLAGVGQRNGLPEKSRPRAELDKVLRAVVRPPSESLISASEA